MLRFAKMNGAGNDFLLINNMEERLDPSLFPQIARTLCHRRLSIGADGLMVVDHPEQGGDYKMLFFNADGSAGEMCGNGARCICRYGYEKGLAGVGSSGDSGTATRVFGTLLTWMQEKKSMVFILATSNDISALKPELLRKGRFDEIFFVDLPNREERKTILNIHIQTAKREISMITLGAISTPITSSSPMRTTLP